MERNFIEEYSDEMAEMAIVMGNPHSKTYLDASDFDILDEVWRYAWEDEEELFEPKYVTDRADRQVRRHRDNLASPSGKEIAGQTVVTGGVGTATEDKRFDRDGRGGPKQGADRAGQRVHVGFTAGPANRPTSYAPASLTSIQSWTRRYAFPVVGLSGGSPRYSRNDSRSRSPVIVGATS
jgi:hypothetical protein